MKTIIRGTMAALALSWLASSPAGAATQMILGKKLQVRDMTGDPAKRRVLGSGQERQSANTVQGDPTASGATLTVIASGASTLAASCASTSSAPERVFAWTPARSGTATIETCDTAATRFDTVVSIRLGACAGGLEMTCNDNTHRCGTAARPNSGSRIRPNVTAGQTYFIIVDGTSSNRSGAFKLRVEPPL